VLEDFRQDGVLYLELRSTPRALADSDAHGYVCTLLDALAEFERTQRRAGRSPLTTRLILSIDRAQPSARADETVQLALELRAAREDARRLIVGIDFSGNPARGDFADFLPSLERVRAVGLPITLHCAEIENDAEITAMLEFRPSRLGHALLL